MLAPWIKDYIGLPWAENGDSRSGVSCYNLCRLVLREQFGIDAPDYRQRPVSRAFASALRDPAWREVATPEPGDLVLLRDNGLPAHCGLVVGDKRMLHVSETTHSCIERYDGPIWANRVLGFYRPAARCAL